HQFPYTSPPLSPSVTLFAPTPASTLFPYTTLFRSSGRTRSRKPTARRVRLTSILTNRTLGQSRRGCRSFRVWERSRSPKDLPVFFVRERAEIAEHCLVNVHCLLVG